MKLGQGHRLAKVAIAIAASLLAVGASASICAASNVRSFGPGALHRVAATEAPSIGVATMAADGTIELRLRATGSGGMVGEGFLTYAPSDPQYAEILRHLDGMKPGETKSVPPWPD
jgi:hypothetical protein